MPNVPRVPKPDPLHTALDAARLGGEVQLEYLHRPLNIREKGRRADLVTAADAASEQAVVERLRADFPAASFLAEETGTSKGTSSDRWIVDPLDGTTNFAHGYPIFCVSIAFERAGDIVAGVIYAPAMDECFAAERGAGATLNGKRLQVSKIASLADSLVCTGFQPARYERNMRYFDAASQVTQGVRRDGSAALNLAYVACGRFDLFWEFDLHQWDTAAGSLMVTEAGGAVTTIEDQPWTTRSESVLASNGLVHAEASELFMSLS